MTDPRRIFILKEGLRSEGPVVCWMQRDQRVNDNWALVYARSEAERMHQPLVVVFCLVPEFAGATIRQFGFMLRGLEETVRRLGELNIQFSLLQGEPGSVLPPFLENTGAGLLIADFNPLKITMTWRREVAEKIRIPFHEVDAHNIIPARFISQRQEYAAFTLRKKVERLLPEFLLPIPPLSPLSGTAAPFPTALVDWESLRKNLKVDRTVGETLIVPGESAARLALKQFVLKRLDRYNQDRNDPSLDGQSELSPYLHFGQLSAQRVALDVRDAHADAASRQAYLEELIVRRELSDNFCLYTENYDRFEALQPWARQTLGLHRDDLRGYTYSFEQFESASTHDPLWNAAQREMVVTGKMHGFMRMYWAKKILEWTRSPEEALAVAIALNDRYSIDGRDPNGYAGIAWAIGGTHDRPWGERSIFGMIRYMNFKGCERKFDVKSYIRKCSMAE